MEKGLKRWIELRSETLGQDTGPIQSFIHPELLTCLFLGSGRRYDAIQVEIFIASGTN